MPHQRPLPYDVSKDFETVCRMSVHSIVLAVPANSPHKTLSDLVKFAKTKDYDHGRGPPRVARWTSPILLFGRAAGIKVTTVPGSGGADAITKLVGGHVDFGGGHPSEVLPHIKAGRLRGLAVAFDERDPSVADIPTFKELGLQRGDRRLGEGCGGSEGYAEGDRRPTSRRKFKAIADDAEFQKIMKDIGQPVSCTRTPKDVRRLVQGGLRPVSVRSSSRWGSRQSKGGALEGSASHACSKLVGRPSAAARLGTGGLLLSGRTGCASEI